MYSHSTFKKIHEDLFFNLLIYNAKTRGNLLSFNGKIVNIYQVVDANSKVSL